MDISVASMFLAIANNAAIRMVETGFFINVWFSSRLWGPNFWAQGPVALECLLPASFSLLFLIKRSLGTKELLSSPKGTCIHFISDSTLGQRKTQKSAFYQKEKKKTAKIAKQQLSHTLVSVEGGTEPFASLNERASLGGCGCSPPQHQGILLQHVIITQRVAYAECLLIPEPPPSTMVATPTCACYNLIY